MRRSVCLASLLIFLAVPLSTFASPEDYYGRKYNVSQTGKPAQDDFFTATAEVWAKIKKAATTKNCPIVDKAYCESIKWDYDGRYSCYSYVKCMNDTGPAPWVLWAFIAGIFFTVVIFKVFVLRLVVRTLGRWARGG